MTRDKMCRMVAHANAAAIEQARREPRAYNWSSKTKGKAWIPGRCLLCGMEYDVLTLHHAESHGFKSREEMIEAGIAVPYEQRKEEDM